MTFRLPQSLSGGNTGRKPVQRPDRNPSAEGGSQPLGHMGHQVEKALARLRAFEAGGPSETSAAGVRPCWTRPVYDRAWAFMIQRELCGLRHWEALVKAYAIPREVLNRMGRVTR